MQNIQKFQYIFLFFSKDYTNYLGKYIFLIYKRSMRDGKRITSIRIATILRKYANYMGVPLKSSHKLRKTYAGNLNANGVPLDCIREMLGHYSYTCIQDVFRTLNAKK